MNNVHFLNSAGTNDTPSTLSPAALFVDTTEEKPLVNSFSATPASILEGETSTLTWNVTGATTVEIDNGVGQVDAASGTKQVSPQANTTYTLTATNQAGETTASVTLTVSSPIEKPTVNSFAASPSAIVAGGSATLSWDVSGATTVEIDNGVGQVDAASGTKQVTPQATTTYTLTATNQAGETTASVTLTVSSPIEKPTVNSFAASPSAIVAGGFATLSWDVSGAETVTIDNGVGQVDAATGTKQVSPQATTTYTLTATNEDGETTASVTLIVSPVEKPTVNSFAASPSAIVAGGSATLSWDVSGATTVEIDKGVGQVDAASGTKQVTPQATTTYTLTATNQAGETTASVTLTVSPVEKPTVNSFAASPSAIVAGGFATLSWDVSGAETVTIDNGVGQVDAATGTKQVSPQATTTYTLTATNEDGETTASVTLIVSPVEKPTVNSFAASPSAIVAGDSATLSWDVSGATTVRIDNGVGQVDPESGTVQVSPQSTTTYTLTATNEDGKTTASATLTVFEKPTVMSFAASPPAIAEGGYATLSWDVSGAETVAIDNGVGQVDPESGTVQVSPDATTTYILAAENQTGETTSSITVTVSGEEIVEEIVDGPGDGVVLIIEDGEFQGTPTSFQAHEQAPADFPLGLFDFTLQSLSPGATVQVEVYTPEPVSESALFYIIRTGNT